ncbi:hypothetical protein D0T84_10220 [Dysgonomonas sp. 521]|uniref:FISUMP domain-containing protein n=1 Tax=Dysgonomonas sp. 521 TaxID=2302932 RepID=UPI0013D251EF|nr:FISUMP domain-containing protein [Dysgonomonas sp. 521]NDV95294.1 hypothetical protein [Dysgonomonas sp. 521]
MNKNILQYCLFAFLSMATLTARAQVTIGGNTPPHDFSILEILSNKKRGLRLPQLSTGERLELEGTEAFKQTKTDKARGLTIFNTTNFCVETWNGEKWIRVCAKMFNPIYNVDSGTTRLNSSGAFVNGTGDTKNRGTDVDHSSMSAGVFRYARGLGKSYDGLDYTHVSGVKVTIPATTLATGSGELPVSVEGTVSSAYAGKAFDIPITVTIDEVEHQLYVRVTTGCGAYTSEEKTIPSPDGDPSWLQFQCFNLGTDQSLDPFTPNETLHGDLYQWGRLADGHEKRSSGVTDILATNIAATVPATVVGKFIYNGYSPFDWLYGGGNEARWGNGTQDETASRGINDPCPDGWKVPTQKQWQSIYKASGNGTPDAATANTWTWTDKGYKVGNALYLPVGGMRHYHSGELDDVDTFGKYWSSTVSGINAYGLSFWSSDIAPGNIHHRVIAHSIRCVAD